ncbi:topology modulation protein [Actinoplanes cyaneus]|uniref:topology modulation protein n=1 Tax=Actinoplanes cyaneus TaxID=52696 RepID=UPI001941658D|nr:topology modulation protein [Actinoplanes cyaneus]MCW2138818.1 hypothetical protein [Actinoplanes cyaneus]
MIHLDELRYDASWNVVSEEEFFAAQRKVVAGARWVVDGNGSASLPIRAAAADTIIVLDPHPLVCLAGIILRGLRYGGGQHPGGVYVRVNCEFLHYVVSYRRKTLPKVLRVLDEHAGHATVLHLTSRRSANRLIRELDDAERGHQ